MTREMKNSGVEWIGDIPSEWKYIKIKYIYNIKKAKLPSEFFSDNSLAPYLTMDYIRGVSDNLQYAKDGDYCTENDLLLIWDGSNSGEIIFNHPCGYAPSTTAILKLKALIDEQYAKYYLKFFEVELRNNTNGMGIPHIDANFLKNAYILFPPLPEQKRIADFLDSKVTEIDKIISETKASIENYKKYKQSVITEAVTKGLDKNVPMKDSGIEWIGKIPCEWKINMLSQIFYQHKCKNKDLQENNLLSLSYGKIKRKNIDVAEGLLPESFDNYNIIDVNDIVLRLTDLQNDHKSLRVGIVKEKGIITSAYITLRSKENIDTDYFYYYLHTFDIHKGFYGMGCGVRQGLNFDELKKLKILYPGAEEQKSIVNFLDNKCAEIDNLISEKEKLITNLEEYKKSLIYEYVTGKKAVE